ncbi:hypothetical protein M8494_06110 [Serratia ureilytica]
MALLIPPARAAVSQHAEPAQVEDCRHRIDALLQIELDIARREAKVGIGDPLRPQEIQAQLTALRQELEQLTDRWQQELALIQEIITLRTAAPTGSGSSADEETLVALTPTRCVPRWANCSSS